MSERGCPYCFGLIWQLPKPVEHCLPRMAVFPLIHPVPLKRTTRRFKSARNDRFTSPKARLAHDLRVHGLPPTGRFFDKSKLVMVHVLYGFPLTVCAKYLWASRTTAMAESAPANPVDRIRPGPL